MQINLYSIKLGNLWCIQLSEVIMGAMASQITSLTIVHIKYATVYSNANQRKYHSSASLVFVRGIHRWPVNSPAQMPSNAEKVSIWWRHHVKPDIRQLDSARFNEHRASFRAIYRKVSNISCTKSPNLNDSRLVLQSPLPNSLKLRVKSRMNM